MFATQTLWSGLSEEDAEAEFDTYALELNLDIDQLHADMELEDIIAKVRNDQRGGNASGVRGTPTVFINGRQLARPTRDRIIEVVEEEFVEATGD